MSAPLAGAAVLLAFAAAWELVGAAGERVGAGARAALAAASGGRASSLGELADRLGLAQRLERAGLTGRVEPRAVVAGKLAGCAAGAAVAVVAAPAVNPRLALVVAGGLLVAGFLAPDAALERRARRRRARFVAALPDALDMLAVGAASGRDPATGLGEIAAGTGGPLATELARAVGEVECGKPLREAVQELRDRLGGAEVGALAAALERSRTYGSPLAEQLYLQATALRREARRRISDHAARSAPKIQLVVALVLVPSVLLTILAAIVAHSGALLAGL
ncbi:MAG: tight adherence protein [Solirubrobacterales bacterium]|jgi:tight adherence protein C|nr:tight adherence protein [Solirubrobacterales bacterium]